MHTWITDKDFYKSAKNLHNKRLIRQVKQAIKLFAGLTGFFKPQENLSNFTMYKLWSKSKGALLFYIYCHILEMHERKDISSDIKYHYRCSFIAMQDFWDPFISISEVFERYSKNYNTVLPHTKCHLYPKWVTDYLIKSHRQKLISLEIKTEKQILIAKDRLYNSKQWSSKLEFRFDRKIANANKYREMWSKD